MPFKFRSPRPAPANSPALPEQAAPIAPDRVCVFICLGSLGSDFAATLAGRLPELKDKLLAIDTAKPTRTGDGRSESPPWQILLSSSDVKTPARAQRLDLLKDELIPGLEYPESASNGAAEVRLFGTIKFAGSIQAVRNRLRQLLSGALRGSGGRPLQVVITSSICGGTGSALILPLALLARDEARMVSPGVTVDVSLLAVLPSYFLSNPEVQQTDRERLRLLANAAATLREIKFIQTVKNSFPLQGALGINRKHPIGLPPVSSIYFFGSEATGATLTPAKLSDRLAAAALTLTHPSLAEIDKNMMVNAGGQYWGVFGRPEHAIVAAAADRVAWLPPAFCDLYAESCLVDALAAGLRKGETEQIEGLMKHFRSRLGLGGIDGGIRQAMGELIPAGRVAVDPELGRRTDEQASAHLTDIHQLFKNELIPKLVATARAKARELEVELVPEATQRVGGEILAGTSSLDMAREVCEALALDLTEKANGYAGSLAKLKQDDYSGRLRDAIGQLGRRRLANVLQASQPRIRAGEACEAWMRAQQDHLTLQLHEKAYRLAAVDLQTMATEIAGRVARLRDRLAEAVLRKEEAERASVSASDALCSIIRPEEAAPFLQRVRQRIEAVLGEQPTPLTPARLMQPGPDELMTVYAAECGARYGSFLRNHLRSLSGAAAFGRLQFSLAGWAQEVLPKLTLPVPLDFLATGGEGNAPNHRYLAAGGEEYARLEELKAARPSLRGLSVVDSGDPFFVVARHRYAGLPFATLPIAELVAAAEHFDEADQKIAVNVLASSGWVVAARNEPLSDDEFTPSEEPAHPVGRRLDPHANGEPGSQRFADRG